MPIAHSPAALPLTDARSEVLRAIMRSFGEEDRLPSRPRLRPAWSGLRPAGPRRQSGPVLRAKAAS